MGFIARILVVAAFVSGAALSGFLALDRVEAEQIQVEAMDDIRTRLREPLPDNASAIWYLALADRAIGMNPPMASVAIEALDLAVKIEPRNGETWGRLAYALSLEGYGDQELIREAIIQSYYRLPIAEEDYRRWRLGLVNTLWSDLPAEVHAAARREAGFESPGWRRRNMPSLEEIQ
jgi:hypothetical protein